MKSAIAESPGTLLRNAKEGGESLRAQRREAGSGEPELRSVPPHAMAGLQSAMGNRALRRMLEPAALQPKLRVDAGEGIGAKSAAQGFAPQNALRQIPIGTLQQSLGNRALEGLFRKTLPSPGGPEISRKCTCGGGASEECAECRKKSSGAQAVHRSILSRDDDGGSGVLGPAGGASTRPGPGEGASSGSDPSSSGAAAGSGLIVEDDADVSAAQMKKSDFLGKLRDPVSTAAQAGLKGSQWESVGSVAIGPWFQYYSSQSAQQLERSIQSSVPASAGVTTASAYIPLVSAQVQSAVGEWARTGKVPAGVPAGLPGMDSLGSGLLGSIGGAVSGAVSSIGSAISSVAQGASNLVSSIGGMLFKAKEGGARGADDPRAIQAQLGTGEALEGGVQGRMSSAFGYDFSGVRVHKDGHAARLSADLNARAFTIGRNVAFGAGEYQPGNPIGDALIAHELAHVVQQGGASAHAPLQKAEGETGKLEQDADVSAVRAVVSLWGGAKAGLADIGRDAIPALRSGLRLSRCKPKASVPCPKETITVVGAKCGSEYGATVKYCYEGAANWWFKEQVVDAPVTGARCAPGGIGQTTDPIQSPDGCVEDDVMNTNGPPSKLPGCTDKTQQIVFAGPSKDSVEQCQYKHDQNIEVTAAPDSKSGKVKTSSGGKSTECNWTG